MRNLLEQGLIKKVNGDEVGAKELFDQYIIERAAQIHGKLRTLQDIELNESFLDELYSRDIFEDEEETDDVSDDFMDDSEEGIEDLGDETDVSMSDEDTISDDDLEGLDGEEENEETDISDLKNDIAEIKDLLTDLTASFSETDDDSSEDLADLAQNQDMNDDQEELFSNEEEIDEPLENDENDEDVKESLDAQIENFLREFEEVSIPKGTEEGLTSDGKKLKIDTASKTLPQHKVSDRVKGEPIKISGPTHSGFNRENAVEKSKGSFNPTATNPKPQLHKAKPVTTDKEGVGADGSKLTGGPVNKGPIAGNK